MYNINAVYGGEAPVFQAWLNAASEKSVVERWFVSELPKLKLVRPGQTTTVLDLGCNSGDMSLRLRKVIYSLGGTTRYLAVDLSSEQLMRFMASAEAKGITDIEFIQCDMEAFDPPTQPDIVFVGHSLYYASNLRRTVQHIVSMAREATIIVHSGKRGIVTVQQAFRRHMGKGRHVVSTDDQVHGALLRATANTGKTIYRYSLESTVDVSACVDPATQRGNDLLSFFLERDIKELSPRILGKLRKFIETTYGPHNYQMTYDISVFVVT